MYKISSLIVFLSLFICGMIHAQIYVFDLAVGNNDGTSWSNAYNDLGVAIDAAQPGDEIWVALGLFTPPVNIVPNGDGFDTVNTYYIDKNIRLYSGFSGTETSIDQRNFDFDRAVIVGDMNGDDLPQRFDTLKDDNARHLFYFADNINDSTVLDGFYVWRGHADGSNTVAGFSDSRGGGIYIAAGATPQILNTAVVECFANQGGGIFAGGLDGTEQILLDNCDLDQNGATDFGAGAAFSNLQSVSLSGCKISRSICDNHAALTIMGVDSALITETEIRDNVAAGISAVYSFEVGGLTFDQVEIIRNEGDGSTVMISNVEGAVPGTVFNQCVIESNYSATGSAGIMQSAGNVSFINSLMAHNTCDDSTNCASWMASGGLVSFNHASVLSSAGPLLNFSGIATLETTNTIFFSNNVVNQGLTTAVSNGGTLCNDASMSALLTGTGDLSDTDPILVDIMGGDYHPEPWSPCVNAAVNSNIEFDIEGTARQDLADIGAFEFMASATANQEISGLNVKVYPTVVKDRLTIELEGQEIPELNYYVTDMSGKIIFSGTMKTKQQTIDVSVCRGKNLIVLQSESGWTTKSFVAH